MTTRLLTWTGLALVIAGIATAAWWLWPRPQLLDPQTAEALLQEANLAIAELENQKLADAIPRLEAIAQALPADPFGPRNLAVATILAIGEGPVTAEQLTAAVAALERLAAIETPSRAFHWLSAKLAMLAGDAEAAAAAFAKVVESDPEDAAAWYGSWQALQLRDETAGGGDGHASILQKACGADPRNLWLAVEWLRAAAIGLDRGALTADASLVQEVENRWTAIAPFAPAVLAFTKTDVREMLDRGIAALESGDTATASGTLRGLANLLVPQAAGDRASVDPHPLEFVIERLSDAARSAAVAAADAAAIPVEYLPRPLPLDSPASAVRLDDIDLDGSIDLVIGDDSTLTVFTQQGTEWTRSLSAPLPAGCDGVLTVDLDLDFDEAKRQAEVAASGTAANEAAAATIRRCPAADLDLIAYGSGGLVCFENRLGTDGASRSLEPLPVPLPMVAGAVRAAAATDLDADGPIDLVLCDGEGLRIWLNHGSQGFVDATPADAMPPREQPIVAIVPVDIDRDIDIDLLLCSDTGVGILENLRHGQFRYRPTSFDHPAQSLDVLDADADGRWDAVVAGPDGLWLVPDVAGTSPQQKVSPQLIDAAPCERLITVDFDNDGWLDVITVSPQQLQAWRGARAGFAAANIVPANTAGVRGLDTADIDGDGDLDLACAGDPLVVLDNAGGNAHHWLAVDLEAQQIKGGDFAPSGRVNAHGLGSLLELKAGALYQPQTVRRRTTHFGLGDRVGADAVRVLWLNGVPQNILQPQADLLICEQQILLGSCPYLYTWDGQGYRFVTDLLWAAPLGLQRSEGELMPDRPQEFISIPRGMLIEADGEYRMQITEELWEAAYFDEVKLLAIDHPPGVEVFSNEKVGPPDLAAFRLHTVVQRKLPAAALTGDGQDVLPLVAAEDGVFLPPSGRKLRQGLTEPSVLELDLGSIDDPSQLTLFLTGWTYPTTVSLNVALGRDPALGLPAPPSLSVPDGAGGWKTVLPMMGFPGGKTKTMAVDLSGHVPAEDPRVRIETTMEIAWDAIFFTSGENPVELVTHELRPLAADLHHRGFSRIEQVAGAGPERFEYGQVETAPKWPPMQGTFTRFGDVRPLLAAQDDRLVVMAAGDEMTLRFSAPPLHRPGWERDFVLASFGWDKDANLATAVGDTSEPLPFASMRSYPPAADDLPPDSEAFRAYVLEFQTRRQTPAFWQALRREFNRLEVGLSRE
ncbi:MAG: FG-GAP-like repeat-containing protein [Pirellulales bacterium]